MKVLFLPPDNGGLLVGMPPEFGLIELPLLYKETPPEQLAYTLSRRREQTFRVIWRSLGLHRHAWNVPGEGNLLEETIPVYEFAGLSLV